MPLTPTSMPVTLTSAEILVLTRYKTKISAEVRVTGIEVKEQHQLKIYCQNLMKKLRG